MEVSEGDEQQNREDLGLKNIPRKLYRERKSKCKARDLVEVSEL